MFLRLAEGIQPEQHGSGRREGYRDDERFLMCSTFKMLLAAAVLERFDVAEKDFSEAVTLNPADQRAYSGRGYVRYFTSRYAEAAADLKRALENKPEGLKAAFLYLAMVRAGDPDAIPELERQAEELNAGTNPGVFPAFFLGRIDEAGMVDIAIRTGIHKPRENESEGYFYAGMARLFAGGRSNREVAAGLGVSPAA